MGQESGNWNEEMPGIIGLGVAGNFAGHLEQAGEASDFKDLKIADATAKTSQRRQTVV